MKLEKKTSIRTQPDNIVRLSVHKNNRIQRKRKELKQQLRYCMNQSLGSVDALGFALVVWDEEGKSSVYWNTNGTMPGVVVPDFVRNVIVMKQAMDANEHD